MVAGIRPEGELVVIFSRPGENDEATIVANGERAAKVAVVMIAGRGVLHAGDPLLVQHLMRPTDVTTVTAIRLKDVTGALRTRRYRRGKKGNDHGGRAGRGSLPRLPTEGAIGYAQPSGAFLGPVPATGAAPYFLELEAED